MKFSPNRHSRSPCGSEGAMNNPQHGRCPKATTSLAVGDGMETSRWNPDPLTVSLDPSGCRPRGCGLAMDGPVFLVRSVFGGLRRTCPHVICVQLASFRLLFAISLSGRARSSAVYMAFLSRLDGRSVCCFHDSSGCFVVNCNLLQYRFLCNARGARFITQVAITIARAGRNK